MIAKSRAQAFWDGLAFWLAVLGAFFILLMAFAWRASLPDQQVQYSMEEWIQHEYSHHDFR